MPDAIDHFDWFAVPLDHRDSVFSKMNMRENGYSHFQGGQEFPYDENTCGVTLEAGWYVVLDAGLKVMPRGSLAGPKDRPPYGKLSRGSQILVGRRVQENISCELWENGRRRWTVWTTDGGVAFEGEPPDDARVRHPADTAAMLCGFDPRTFPLANGERFIRI